MRSGKLARVACQKRVFNYANAGAGGEAGWAMSSPLDVGLAARGQHGCGKQADRAKTEAQGGPTVPPPREPRTHRPQVPCVDLQPTWSNPLPTLSPCTALLQHLSWLPSTCESAARPSPSTSQLCGPGLIT